MKTRSIAAVIGMLVVGFALWFYLNGPDTPQASAPAAAPHADRKQTREEAVETDPPQRSISTPALSVPDEEPRSLAKVPAPPATEEDEVDIKIDYPKPPFMSIPVVANLPNLEPPNSTRPLMSFRAPRGTGNIALAKKVTSSDPAPIIGSLDLITDGDASGLHGAFVELAPGPQWVQIDLDTDSTIFKIMMWHYHKEPRAYVDVIVQIAADPDFRSGVTTVFNADHDNTLGMGAGADPAYLETNHGRLIDCGTVRGRYVRLTSNGNTQDELNHYCEVVVYGLPEK